MLTFKDINPDRKLSTGIALTFAVEVLHVFEQKYPEDLRPRKALEAAMKYLQDSSVVNAMSAVASADAAYDAYATYAYSHASYAAYAASQSAYAASASFSHSVIYAVRAATDAASAIKINTGDKWQYIHDKLLKILPLILEHKIKNGQSFGSPEKVMEYLSGEDRDKFLFNLDVLA